MQNDATFNVYGVGSLRSQPDFEHFISRHIANLLIPWDLVDSCATDVANKYIYIRRMLNES